MLENLVFWICDFKIIIFSILNVVFWKKQKKLVWNCFGETFYF